MGKIRIVNSKIGNIISEYWNDPILDKPMNNRMKPLIDMELFSPRKESIYFFLNILARTFLPEGIYLEIGIHRGASLISIAYENPNIRCIGIDHFKLHKRPDEDIEAQLIKNINKSKVQNVEYYKMEGLEGIKHLFSVEPDLKVDMFYYDATHEYEPQLNTMTMMIPYLSDNCLICIDDLSMLEVTKALESFLSINPDFTLRFITIPKNDNNWNKGFAVISRGNKYG